MGVMAGINDSGLRPCNTNSPSSFFQLVSSSSRAPKLRTVRGPEGVTRTFRSSIMPEVPLELLGWKTNGSREVCLRCISPKSVIVPDTSVEGPRWRPRRWTLETGVCVTNWCDKEAGVGRLRLPVSCMESQSSF